MDYPFEFKEYLVRQINLELVKRLIKYEPTIEVRVDFDSIFCEINFPKLKSVDKRAYFSIGSVPNSTSYLMFYNVYIGTSLRKKGLGSYLHKCRLEAIKEFCLKEGNNFCDIGGPKAILCTVQSNNLNEKHILQKYGWKCINEDVTELWIYPLKYKEWSK